MNGVRVECCRLRDKDIIQLGGASHVNVGQKLRSKDSSIQFIFLKPVQVLDPLNQPGKLRDKKNLAMQRNIAKISVSGLKSSAEGVALPTASTSTSTAIESFQAIETYLHCPLCRSACLVFAVTYLDFLILFLVFCSLMRWCCAVLTATVSLVLKSTGDRKSL